MTTQRTALKQTSRTSIKNVRVDTHLSVEEVAEVEEGEGVGEEWKRKKKE